ncbi:cupredoxin family copper-binding protein [Mesorhizobium sp. Z1-4]|uniref:cupredoxin domain-containing protein n=1 Tax=Mesorhizobium sp. Z1-4 TaxID=2448478 RepID=UPI000FDB22CE|nr:cupredoxin family copper-binding protein [Mesorhizobium sp. Z1-4]
MSRRNRRSVLAGGVAAFAAALSGRAAFSHNGIDHSKEGAAHHTVTIERFKFVPAAIEAKPGDTVTWTNADIAPHTATAADASWDTGTIRKGEAKSITVSAGMAPDYFCRFHPAMKGTIGVHA